MLPNRNTQTDLGLLVLRIGIGVLMIYGHGWGKLLRVPGIFEKFADPIGVGTATTAGFAVFAEFFCSALIIFGLFTRFATVPLIITMAVAGLFHHADDPWKKKELAFVYLVPYLTLLFTGGGKYALDFILLRKNEPRQEKSD